MILPLLFPFSPLSPTLRADRGGLILSMRDVTTIILDPTRLTQDWTPLWQGTGQDLSMTGITHCDIEPEPLPDSET